MTRRSVGPCFFPLAFWRWRRFLSRTFCLLSSAWASAVIVAVSRAAVAMSTRVAMTTVSRRTISYQALLVVGSKSVRQPSSLWADRSLFTPAANTIARALGHCKLSSLRLSSLLGWLRYMWPCRDYSLFCGLRALKTRAASNSLAPGDPPEQSEAHDSYHTRAHTSPPPFGPKNGFELASGCKAFVGLCLRVEPQPFDA